MIFFNDYSLTLIVRADNGIDLRIDSIPADPKILQLRLFESYALALRETRHIRDKVKFSIAGYGH